MCAAVVGAAGWCEISDGGHGERLEEVAQQRVSVAIVDAPNLASAADIVDVPSRCEGGEAFHLRRGFAADVGQGDVVNANANALRSAFVSGFGVPEAVGDSADSPHHTSGQSADVVTALQTARGVAVADSAFLQKPYQSANPVRTIHTARGVAVADCAFVRSAH